MRVSDLQVAVPRPELLPAHDLPLQLPQRDVRAVKNHRVGAEFGGEFIVNVSHVEIGRGRGKKQNNNRPKTVKKRCHSFFVCGDHTGSRMVAVAMALKSIKLPPQPGLAPR